MKFRNILTTLFFITNIYSFGGGVMGGSPISYPSWKFVGDADFPAFHEELARGIYPFFVPVFFASVPISILMIWFGHQAIPRKFLVATAVVNLSIFIATIALAIPIQNQLDASKSQTLIDRLIVVDLWFRIVPGLIGMALNFVILDRVLQKATA